MTRQPTKPTTPPLPLLIADFLDRRPFATNRPARHILEARAEAERISELQPTRVVAVWYGRQLDRVFIDGREFKPVQLTQLERPAASQ